MKRGYTKFTKEADKLQQVSQENDLKNHHLTIKMYNSCK